MRGNRHRKAGGVVVKSTVRFEARHKALDDLMNSSLSRVRKAEILDQDCEYQDLDYADKKIYEALGKEVTPMGAPVVKVL